MSNLVSVTKVLVPLPHFAGLVVGHCPDSMELSFYCPSEDTDAVINVSCDSVTRNRSANSTRILAAVGDSHVHLVAPQVLKQFVASFDYQCLSGDVITNALEAKDMKPFKTFVALVEGLAVTNSEVIVTAFPELTSVTSTNAPTSAFADEVTVFVSQAISEPCLAASKVLEMKSYRLASNKR